VILAGVDLRDAGRRARVPDRLVQRRLRQPPPRPLPRMCSC